MVKENIKQLLAEVVELKAQLSEANNIIEAIRDGAVDALIVNKNGRSEVYSVESADYTYRILVEKFGEGALTMSEKGVILYCNEYFAKIIGSSTDKVVGTYFDSLIESVGQFQGLKTALLQGPSKGEVWLNINGKKIPVFLSLTDLSPQIEAIGIIVTDLTEKRKNEEALAVYQRKLEIKINELNASNTNLEQFIHVISHDIKEPIRKIIAYTSHLGHISGQHLDKDIVRNLKVITTSAARLNSLVEDLVKYSSSTVQTTRSDVDLNGVLKQVLDDLELVVQENEAVIHFKNLPTVLGSEVQMRQVFSNLITNAIKYKRAEVPPKITISCDVTYCVDLHFPNKKFYRVCVHDNGIGMAKEHLAKIFTVFQRLHMPGEYTGNGIGLSICKKIMENHFGKIDVESVVGKGSTFRLFFPLKN
jgi:PAS domain S-box-containing protein